MEENKEIKEAEITEEKEKVELPKAKEINPEKVWMTFFFIMTAVAVMILLFWVGTDIREGNTYNDLMDSARNSSFYQGYEQGKEDNCAYGVKEILNKCDANNCDLFCINKSNFWYVRNASLMKCEPIKELQEALD